jgi:hypothetical protein
MTLFGRVGFTNGVLPIRVAPPWLLRAAKCEFGALVCILAFGCAATPASPKAAAREHVVSACPDLSQGTFDDGELILAHSFTPEPEFKLTRLVYSLDGRVVFDSEAAPNSFILLREVVPDRNHTITVVAELEGVGSLAGYKFKTPSFHSFHAGGTGAVCVETHILFKDGVDPAESLYLRYSEVRLEGPAPLKSQQSAPADAGAN